MSNVLEAISKLKLKNS